MTEAPSQKRPCPNNCGYLNAPDAAFCAGCGAALPGGVAAPGLTGARRPSAAVAAEIRAMALGSLIGGLVALYFGFSLVPTAVVGASDAANALWLGIDQAAIIVLRVVGATLLLTAAVCLTGKSTALVLALLAESGASVVFTGYGLVQLLKWRSPGLMGIVFLALGIMSIAALVQAWRLYRATQARPV